MTASCRRTQPSLIDRNQAPDTQLWYAPPDSTEYEYIVHMYWRGLDADGTTTRFIWAIQDTIQGQGLSWNPALRLRDYRLGRITSRTDSVFSFKAYKDVAGVGVRKNRQAFFVASIDDNGVIDPEPAAVEFVATIGELPEIRFVNYLGTPSATWTCHDTTLGLPPRPYVNRTPPADTVGMYKPFAISYHGLTVNGRLRGYEYFPLSTTIVLPGSNIWTEDLCDTVRLFPNTKADPLPAGTFRFAAKCIDDAGAESQVDAGRFAFGVSQIVVNFIPDTWVTEVRNTYYDQDRVRTERVVDFTDNVPDTVPYRSWVTLFYYAHDDRRDEKICSPTNNDECINFQLKYIRDSQRATRHPLEDSGWQPSNAVHDSDPNSTADSNSVNMGSNEYRWFIGAVDENNTRDGTPAEVPLIGNLNPTIDTYSIEDHFGNVVNLASLDTLTWNFYKGIGWPYDSKDDTVQSDDRYFKRYGFTIRATGHDDKRDPVNSAVKAWRFQTYTDYNSPSDPGTFWALGRGGVGWFPGSGPDAVAEQVIVTVKYADSTGVDLFANLPGYINQILTVVLTGRDTQLLELDFTEYVFWNVVPANQSAGNGVSTKNTVNTFGAEESGRWSPDKVASFYLQLKR